MKRALILAIACVVLAMLVPAVQALKKQNHDPDAAELVFSDLDLFWKAYDNSRPENRAAVLRAEYLNKGTFGLKEFTRKRIGSAESLARVIEKHPKYYASLREASRKAPAYKDAIRAAFRKLKELYEPAVFPSVYFLIGSMTSAGTPTEQALLIGVDMHGRTKNMPVEELSAWEKAVVMPIEQLPYIVAHELIHYQQSYLKGNLSLLGMALSEGSADFLGEMISGGHINRHLHQYGNPRERELWADFKLEMNGNDLSNWLFQGDRAKDRPADLGYYIGYKICESYYKHAADKKQAIKAILEITDFKEFLKASKYDTTIPAGDVVFESAPPVVVKTVPEAGAAEVDAKLTEIKVTFSKDMQDGSWSWNILSRESFPTVAGKPRYLEDKRTCVLPVKLAPGKTYAIWVNNAQFNDFKDTAGRSAVPYLLVFRTRNSSAQTSPW